MTDFHLMQTRTSKGILRLAAISMLLLTPVTFANSYYDNNMLQNNNSNSGVITYNPNNSSPNGTIYQNNDSYQRSNNSNFNANAQSNYNNQGANFNQNSNGAYNNSNLANTPSTANYGPNGFPNNDPYYGRPNYYQRAALSQFSLCYAFQDNNKNWSPNYRGEGALLDGYHLNGVLPNANFRDDSLFLVLPIRNQNPVIIDMQQRQGLSTVPTVLEDINGVSWRVSRTLRNCIR